MKKKLILIDGSFYLYRAYYALPNLMNSGGFPTGAIYGFLNMFNKIINNNLHNYIIIIFDSVGKSFRKKIFNNYKLKRIRMPKNLIVQIKPLYNIIKSMGYHIISMKNIEADDIIGTVAIKAVQNNYFVSIFSIDKDMAQLVSNDINLINPVNNFISGPNEIYNKYGVMPNMISDLLALQGDPIDNIPGVKGIGKKISAYLINNIGNLKCIYKNINFINNLNIKKVQYIKKCLLNNKKLAFLSHKLTKIKTNININIDLNNLYIYYKPNEKHLLHLYKKYEFQKLINNIKNKNINFI
ncbi:flap endonuclease [Enterobacteriaceae endosymbiont of Plateumaris consimilis]|uniref:5'-3' exonuclease n=1 Tax=Enterobacteriaceae endosymbiont of Plateumaris consimilis TaxID=2675794 RepID=UPI0014495351|nr:5'-3' exonuclease H3TH domain-containing protein [Enterobacteriaceae endosymbiont of Plateumaris consimilis]QJC28784.1 flap endonuclease [Enterobacteriaceae endosymbiont of Plateumaris consimilis]